MALAHSRQTIMFLSLFMLATPTAGVEADATRSQIIHQNFNPGTGSQPSGPLFGVAAARLQVHEVQVILSETLNAANQARAGIRRLVPRNQPVQLTISVVDLEGNLLGFAGTPDAPVFGTETSVQKAQNAASSTSSSAANELTIETSSSDRGIGNLARPGFPDGINRGVPIYRIAADGSATMIGAIGVSCDDGDQDEVIAFLGLDRAFEVLAALH